MGVPYEISSNGETTNSNLQIIRYSPFDPCMRSPPSSLWFDLKVFYVRISNLKVNDSTPKSLTLNHMPLSHDTLLEVNGSRSGIYSDGISSLLRRDRADKKSEEATFVSTDSIRLTGSVKFEVFNKEDLILCGVLEMSNRNGFTGEMKNSPKRWSMNCEAVISAGNGFFKGKHVADTETPSPTIEVYVAGSFAGTPIILTKTLQPTFRKKHNRNVTLDAIPENETTEGQNEVPIEYDLQAARYRLENEQEYNMRWRTECIDGEDGELSWFNAGVRVGVGIGLGVCLGVGVGVGLLVRSYQSTTRNFRRLV